MPMLSSTKHLVDDTTHNPPHPTEIRDTACDVADLRTDSVILILADISGFTEFVRSHKCRHACAERIVCELLRAVVDRAGAPLQLHQLLGDAAVFYALSDGSAARAREIFDHVERMCERFRERAGELTRECGRCPCHAGRDASKLKLKVILHHGHAAIASLGGIENLVGEDVIVAHRLLKNSIRADEYVLATSAFQRHLGDPVGKRSEHRRERCEGIGAVGVTVYHPRHDRPPRTPPRLPRRLTTGQSRERLGVALVLGSAVCFGALGVLTQLAYGAGVPVLSLLSGRYVLAAAVLWLVVLGWRRPLPPVRGVLVGLALGAGYSVQALLFAASLKHLPAGLADLLYFAYPALVAAGAVALRRELWSRRHGAALIAASGGIGLALASAGAVDPLGVTLALAAAVGYAAYVIAASSLLKGTDPLVLATLLCSGAAIALGADASAHGELVPGFGLVGVLLVAAVALVSTVLGIGAFLAGVQRLGPSRASLVSSVEPALTAAFGFAIFGGHFGAMQLVGVALVFASVPILEVRRWPVTPGDAKSIPVLAGLSWCKRIRVVRHVREVDVAAGTRLFAQGEHARDFFLIRRGTATMVRNDAHLADLGAGEFFGEGAPLGIPRRRASVTAATDMRLLVVRPRGFRALRSSPRIAEGLRRAMQARFGIPAGATA